MNEDLRGLLKKEWPDLSPDAMEKIDHYHCLLEEENRRQNLTRLIEPKDFVEGHVIDVKEMLGSGFVDFPAMDLGSGCGVPGLLAAMIRQDAWVLAESERQKAQFLFRVVRELGLTSVRVVADRGENFLVETALHTVVARAVGPIDRIYSWLQPCSTWNSVVLLKGPGWQTEWETFNRSKYSGELNIEKIHEYSVGDEEKKRVVVRLERVPRGT